MENLDNLDNLDLDKIAEQILKMKETQDNQQAEVKVEEVNENLPIEIPKPTIDESQTNVLQVVSQEEKKMLETDMVKEASRLLSEEKIKSDLAEEASKIRKRNQEIAESVFETETRELRLKHLKEQLDRQHKYEMETLEEDAKHSQMLDRRKKLVQKFSYLYNNEEENLIDCLDGKGNAYKAPRDFSYSPTVNKFRQLGRNISKLDKPMIQTIKWIVIIALGVGGVFLLKKFNIL